MKVFVELSPHIGLQQTDLGLIEIEHPQWMVHATSDQAVRPVFVVYVGKETGRAFCPAGKWSDLPIGLQEAIHEALCEKIGERRPLGIAPISIKKLQEAAEEAAGHDESAEDSGVEEDSP